MICFGTPFPSNYDVEQAAGFKFPFSAKNIEFDANGVNRKAGCTIWVKFEMESNELKTFANSTSIEALSSSIRLEGDAFNYLSEVQNWEQPTSSLAGHGVPVYSRFISLVPSYGDQWIFIDTTHDKMWTVYLIANFEWL